MCGGTITQSPANDFRATHSTDGGGNTGILFLSAAVNRNKYYWLEKEGLVQPGILQART